MVPRNFFVLCECMLTEDFLIALWSQTHRNTYDKRKKFAGSANRGELDQNAEPPCMTLGESSAIRRKNAGNAELGSAF